ncbi:TPA: HD-GYP domain-containing protein [bacterium]|nr:HD-GYP domain-containing protein [bacterium]
MDKENEIDSLTKEIVTLYEELTLLYDVSETISSFHDIDKITSGILRQIGEVLHIESISVALWDKLEELLVIKASLGLPEETKGMKIPLGEGGIFSFVVKEGKPKMGPDARTDPVVKDLLMDSAIAKPYICVPLKAADEVIGLVLAIAKQDKQTFSSRDLKLLLSAAIQTAIVIKNAQLVSDLKWLFITTVKAISSAIEAKDPYTHGHSTRVTLYSLVIADQLGLSREIKENIRLAGILHDVGKIGIPVEILNKPSGLSKEEYDEIKKHPDAGSKIVEGIEHLVKIVPGIRHHHERYDGQGYPDHLQKENIPLLGRILAVADAFDAITSDRPYRRAECTEVALDELRKHAGTQFDPEIVDAFFLAYEQGKIYRPETENLSFKKFFLEEED